MKIIKDVYYSNDQISAKALDAYIPDGKTNAVFMYMHGGGLEKGDKSVRAEDIAKFLEQEGIAFVSINYRMYPDAQYPDFICDAAQAVAWVNKNMQELFACDKLYVGGSSAGGYLFITVKNVFDYFHQAFSCFAAALSSLLFLT